MRISRSNRERAQPASYGNSDRVGGRVSKADSRHCSWRSVRSDMGRRRVVRRRALRIEQNPSRPLYVFTLTGEEVLRVAEISRVRRSEQGRLLGYQRDEVRRHIRNIAEYLYKDAV